MTPRKFVAVALSFVFTVFSVLAVVIIPTAVASADQISQVQDEPIPKPIKCKSSNKTAETRKRSVDSQSQSEAELYIDDGLNALGDDLCTEAREYFTKALKVAKVEESGVTLAALFGLTHVSELLKNITEEQSHPVLRKFNKVFRPSCRNGIYDDISIFQCNCPCVLGPQTGNWRNGRCPCVVGCPR